MHKITELSGILCFVALRRYMESKRITDRGNVKRKTNTKKKILKERNAALTLVLVPHFYNFQLHETRKQFY